MSKWMAGALLLLPLVAHAQQVHKCKLQDGSAVYQSQPCEGATTEKTWDARQYEVDPRRLAQINRERRAAEAHVAAQRSQPAAAYRASARAGTAAQSRHAQCEAAKRRRDQELERLGLRRTHADLRRWGDYVYERCKP